MSKPHGSLPYFFVQRDAPSHSAGKSDNASFIFAQWLLFVLDASHTLCFVYVHSNFEVRVFWGKNQLLSKKLMPLVSGQHVAIILTCLLVAACMPKESAAKKACEDVSAVCNFTAEILFGLDKFIARQEWQAINSKKHSKTVPLDIPEFIPKTLYIYVHDGVEIQYTLSDRLNVWKVRFSGERLPKDMRVKQYFVSRFKMPPDLAELSKFQSGCDANDLTIQFSGSSTSNLEVEMSMGAI